MSYQVQQAGIALEVVAQIDLLINDPVEVIDRLSLSPTAKIESRQSYNKRSIPGAYRDKDVYSFSISSRCGTISNPLLNVPCKKMQIDTGCI